MTFRSKRVDTEEAFLHELEHNRPDVILSDHGLPSFDGFMALTIAREKCPEIPFIFVTGKLGEQIAIETLRNGATDYVLKSNLTKLAPTIERALREVEGRALVKQQELQLRESEERYRQLVEFCPDAYLVQCEGQVVFANRAAAHLLGAEDAPRLVGKPIAEIIHPQSLQPLEARFQRLIQDGTIFFWRKIEKGKAGKQGETGDSLGFTEEKFIQLNGSPVVVEVAATPLTFQGRPAIQIIARDITGRKQAEEALRENAERYRMLVENVRRYAIYMIDPTGRVQTWNAGAERILGYHAEEIVGKFFTESFLPEDIERFAPGQLLQRAENEGQVLYDGERVQKNGSRFWIHSVITALRDGAGKLRGYSEIAREVTRQTETPE